MSISTSLKVPIIIGHYLHDKILQHVTGLVVTGHIYAEVVPLAAIYPEQLIPRIEPYIIASKHACQVGMGSRMKISDSSCLKNSSATAHGSLGNEQIRNKITAEPTAGRPA